MNASTTRCVCARCTTASWKSPSALFTSAFASFHAHVPVLPREDRARQPRDALDAQHVQPHPLRRRLVLRQGEQRDGVHHELLVAPVLPRREVPQEVVVHAVQALLHQRRRHRLLQLVVVPRVLLELHLRQQLRRRGAHHRRVRPRQPVPAERRVLVQLPPRLVRQVVHQVVVRLDPARAVVVVVPVRQELEQLVQHAEVVVLHPVPHVRQVVQHRPLHHLLHRLLPLLRRQLLLRELLQHRDVWDVRRLAVLVPLLLRLHHFRPLLLLGIGEHCPYVFGAVGASITGCLVPFPELRFSATRPATAGQALHCSIP
eukprot:Sspe_Gene.1163::Locus_398_Transcript_2_2_Confidence_0.667_Length_1961::g.1163::m.1163